MLRYDDVDWSSVLRALIDVTQSRRIRWQVDSRMQSPGATSAIYRGAYKGFNIVLFKFAVDVPDGSFAGDLEDVCILIVDEDGKELFRLPADSQRWQLLKLVQYEAADISTFIEDLFGQKMMDVYVVVESGDDYHGSRLVHAFTDEDKAKACARDCNLNQTNVCGRETCDHKYSYLVYKIPMD